MNSALYSFTLLNGSSCQWLSGRLCKMCQHAAAEWLSVCGMRCRTLPEAWAQMHRMQFLQLSQNLLSGPLPAGWGATNSFPMLQAIQMVTAPAPGRRHRRAARCAGPPD